MPGILLVPRALWRCAAPCLGLLFVMGCRQPAPMNPAESLLPDLAMPMADGGAPDGGAPDAGPPCPFPRVLSAGFPPLPTSTTTHLWSSGPKDLWLAGKDGTPGHFDGSSFTPLPSVPHVASLGGVSGNGTSDVWMSGSGGVMLHFDGTKWTSLATSTTQQLGDVWAPRKDRVWTLAGSDIIRWDGTAFHTESTGTTQTLTALWGILAPDGTAQVWAIGKSGTLIYGKTPGTFAPLAGPTSADLQAIWGSSPSDIWVGATFINKPLYHWDGTSWSAVSLPGLDKYSLGYFVTSLWGSGPSDVWAVVNNFNHGYALYHWDGTAWSRVTLPPRVLSVLVTGSAAGEVWVVGTDNYGGQAFPNKIPYLLHGDTSGLQLVGGEQAGAVVGDRDSFMSLGYPATLQWDGTAWLPPTSDISVLDNFLVQFSPSDAWRATSNGVDRWNGTAWSTVFAKPTNIYLDHAIGKNASGEVWVWDGTALDHWDGTSFLSETCSLPHDYNQYGWSGLFSGGAGDVWLFGSDQTVKGGALTVLHRTPAGCALVTPAFPTGFYGGAAWAGSTSDVWVIGHDKPVHFDGTTWTAVDAGTPNSSYSGIWGFSSTDVWADTFNLNDYGDAITRRNIVHWDGHTWSIGSCGESIVHVGVGPSGHWALTSSARILSE